jgi:hypothetical protein
MNSTRNTRIHSALTAALALAMLCASTAGLRGGSLDIPARTWGLSFGNSPEFTGLRFNFRDSTVVRVTGVNITFWMPAKDNKDSVVHGLSLGVAPGAGDLKGVHLGLLGVAANKSADGICVAGLGVAVGTSLFGIAAGGLGVAAGDDLTGLAFGGLGVGAGKNVLGIAAGGLGVGAGGDFTGVAVGGLGVGAGGSMAGVTIGGLGAGAGKDMVGLNIGGIGLGAGKNLTGLNIAGLAAGAGERLTGLTLCGLAAGGKEVTGLTVAGLAVGGQVLTGAQIAGAMVHVPKDGRLTGFAASPFNYIRGSQTGLSIGIVNYAFHVDGVQIGLVNIVRDNPRYLKVLPVFNTSF